jgi:hypothetical protein
MCHVYNPVDTFVLNHYSQFSSVPKCGLTVPFGTEPIDRPQFFVPKAFHFLSGLIQTLDFKADPLDSLAAPLKKIPKGTHT